jgi:general secretion pathway protein F
VTVPSTFHFRAVRPDGAVERGRMEAASLATARLTLETRGLLTLEIRQESAAAAARNALPVADLALGLRMLSDLFDAGLPMTRVLATFGTIAPPSWQQVLPHLVESVREGKSFGSALRDAPVELPPLVIGMAVAGEIAGDLGAAVRRAADLMEGVAATRAAVRNALAYPIVLGVAGLGAIGILVGVVIPRFALILSDLGQTLPATTRFVLNASVAARASVVPAIVAGLLMAVAWRVWMSTGSGRRQLHHLLLAVPLLRTVRESAATTRSTFTLALLLETGVPLRQAMALAAKASGDAAIEARIQSAAHLVETGSALGRAMGQTEALTPLALRLVQAGEESGRLTSMLRHAAKLEQERGDRIVRTTVRLLEPALILVFAGIVAVVAAALLQAVYSVRPIT